MKIPILGEEKKITGNLFYEGRGEQAISMIQFIYIGGNVLRVLLNHSLGQKRPSRQNEMWGLLRDFLFSYTIWIAGSSHSSTVFRVHPPPLRLLALWSPPSTIFTLGVTCPKAP